MVGTIEKATKGIYCPLGLLSIPKMYTLLERLQIASYRKDGGLRFVLLYTRNLKMHV